MMRGKPLPDPESGSFGGAILHSYTGFFVFGVIWGLGSLVTSDLGPAGAGRLRTAFGVASNGWVHVCIGVAFIAMSFPVSAASAVYHRYTGRYYTQDRIGFAKSGGQDIGTWCGLLPLVVTIVLFAYVVPPGLLGFGRALVILIVPTLVGNLLASYLMERVLAALFGRRPRVLDPWGGPR